MYCPQCSAEYREGFTQCSTCSVPLIEAHLPKPLPDEEEWMPTTRLGSKGTKLILLYLIQVFVIGITILFRGLELGALPFIYAIGIIASGLGIFARNRFALHLIYSVLAVHLIYSVVNIAPEMYSFIVGDIRTLANGVGKVAGGVLLPIAWFLYFRRRRNLFA